MKPLGKRILVKGIKEDKRASGLYVPIEKKESKGEVISVGDTDKVAVGDVVLFIWPFEISHNGESLYIVDEGNIIAKL